LNPPVENGAERLYIHVVKMSRIATVESATDFCEYSHEGRVTEHRRKRGTGYPPACVSLTVLRIHRGTVFRPPVETVTQEGFREEKAPHGHA